MLPALPALSYVWSAVNKVVSFIPLKRPSFEVLINPIKLAPVKYLSCYRISNWSELSFSTFKSNQLLFEGHENNCSTQALAPTEQGRSQLYFHLASSCTYVCAYVRHTLQPSPQSTNQAETWHRNQLQDQYENPTFKKKIQQLNSCQQLITAVDS